MDNLNSINNNGVPYYFKADVAKEGGQYVRLSNFFKARVGDNGKVLPFKWYDQGRVMNVHEYIPFIKGLIGQFSTDDNDEVIMAPDASYREWQGSTANAHDGGFMDYILEDQMFPKEGIFKGHFGLKDGNGNVLTSVNIIFEVLGDDLRVGDTVKYYVGELENLKKQYQVDNDTAVNELRENYKQKAQQSEDELDSINKNFETINSALKSVGLSTAALQNQIDSEDLETVPNHNADIYLLKQDIVNRFGQLRHPTQVFDSLAQIQAKYPNGADGSMLATDNGHIYVYNWNTNLWKDFGAFQAQGLPPEVTENLSKSVKGYKILLKEINPPYDNLDTLPANQVVTYAYPEYTANVRNWPANNTGRMGTVLTLSASGQFEDGGTVQMIFFDSGEMQYRTNWGSPAKYNKWQGLPLTAQVIQQHIDTIQPPYNDLNELPENSLINYSHDLDKLQNSPIDSDEDVSGIVITTNSAIGYGTIQIVLTLSGRNYWRFKWYDGNTWIHWLSNGNTLNNKRINMKYQIKSEYADLHTIKNNKSVTYSITSGDFKGVENRPSDNPLTITTINGTNDDDQGGQVQIAVDANGQMFYSINWYNRWTNWAKVITNQDTQNTDFTSVAMFRSIGIIGDSYASGELAISGNTDHYNMSWGQIMARRNGATAINFSKGGQTTRGWLSDQERGLGLLKSAPSLDLYILALGINDYGKLGADYIGTTGDMGTDADTFYGNYGKIIQAIKDKSPNAKIVISTLSQTGTVPDSFSSAIRNIAQHYGIPCLELNSDPFFTSDYYLSHMHGGHPTGPVYSGMAKAYERLIEKSMFTNLDYFENFENDRETDGADDLERIKKLSN